MNGYYYDDYDAIEDPEDDDAFFEDDGELDLERRGRRGGRRAPAPKGARGAGYNQPRPSNSKFVTHAQFQAATMRIENDVKKLNEADKTLSDRINANVTRLDRHAAAIKKENAARKKADMELRNTLLLLAIAPIILKPKSVSTTINGQTAKVLVEEDNFLKTLLPIGLTLLGGQLGGLLGGLGGTGYGTGGGTNTGTIL